LDDNEDKTDETEDNEDEEISSNDSDYSPKKANKGFEIRKRKKMESSERASSTNVVDQLQQHRLQQIIEKNRMFFKKIFWRVQELFFRFLSIFSSIV